MKPYQLFAVAVLACTVTSIAQVPLPVAERFSSQRGETTRVSLFTNGAVVVTISTDGVQTFLRQFTLPPDQYLTYLGVFQTAAAEIGEEPVSSNVGTSHSEVTVFLHVGPNAPRKIRFSPMASVSLPLSKVMGALDDLQQQGLEASPSAEAMRTWQPKRRDRVQLFNGTFATVKEVWDDGMIVIEHDSTYVREMVPPMNRDKVILRVVESGE
jgi:hypothetical protein